MIPCLADDSEAVIWQLFEEIPKPPDDFRLDCHHSVNGQELGGFNALLMNVACNEVSTKIDNHVWNWDVTLEDSHHLLSHEEGLLDSAVGDSEVELV